MSVTHGDRYYMSSVKIGPKGQIVIPKEVRDMFGIESGNSVLLMADKEKGIAIQPLNVVKPVVDRIFSGHGDKDLRPFAEDVQKSIEEESKE